MAVNRTITTGFTRQDADIPVRPTLLIGLGGTGMEVLKRLRRLFILRHGSAGLPCMRYLWMDTDKTAIDDGGKDSRIPGVKFNANEFIDLTLPATSFRHLVDSPNQYRHIHSWLDPKVQAMPDIVNGASQNRQAGRLTFFAHYAEIQNRILQLVADLTSASVSNQMTRSVDQGGMGYANYDSTTLEIILVNSLAGGTGAGCFLDLAFFLKNQIGRGWQCATQISCYAFLPRIFFNNPLDNGQGQTTHANAMAALRELEYYSSRRDKLDKEAGQVQLASKHDYRVKWDPNGDDLTIIGPPFDLMYLVDNQTDKSAPLTGTHVKEAYEMVANRLFMAYSESGFAVKLRSTGNNMRGFLAQDVLFIHQDNNGNDLHMEQFGQRFCSLGLSRVYVPADEIRRACGARMSRDLLDHWLRDRSLEGNAREVTNSLFTDFELDLKHMMGRHTKEDASDWRAFVAGEVNKANQDLQQSLGGTERKQLDKRVNQHYSRINALFEIKANQPPQQWGKVAAALEHDLPKKAQDHTENLVERRLREWFAQPHRGIRFSQAALARIVTDLSPQIEDLRARADKKRKAAEREKRRIQKYMTYLRDEQIVFPCQRSSLKALLSAITESLDKHYSRRIDTIALERTIAHHEWLIGYLGQGSHRDPDTNHDIGGSGVIQRCQTLENELVGIRKAFDDSLANTDRGQAVLSEYRIYESGDYEQYYYFQPPGTGNRVPIGSEQLNQLELAVFQETGIESLADLPKFFEQRGIGPLRLSIEALSFDWFTPIRNQMDLDLRTHLNRLEDPQIASIKETLSSWGEPWAQVPWDSNISMQKLLVIGLHPDHQQNEVLAGIADFIQDNSMNCVTQDVLEGDRDSLWVSTEVYGLPAYSVRNIEQYREAYERELRRSSERHSTCHVHLFPSIQFMGDSEVQRHIEVIETILNSVLLRIVDVNLVTHSRSGLRHCEFSFIDRSVASPVEVQLSHWDQALRLLKKHEAWTESLDSERLLRLNKLRKNDPLAHRLLLAMHQMIKAGKRFGRRFINDVSDTNIEVISAEFTVLNKLVQQLLAKRGWSVMELNDYVDSLEEQEITDQLEKIADDSMILLVPME